MSTARTLTAPVPGAAPVASEAVARWIWPGLVFALLGMQGVLGVVAVMLATGDPAWRVVPHYHDRAIHWDRVATARAASEQLGWKTTITPGTTADIYGHRDITVTLTTADGKPLSGATVKGELWHHARPGDLVELTLRESAEQPGLYMGRARASRSGLWQVELNVRKAGDEFIHSEEVNWTF